MRKIKGTLLTFVIIFSILTVIQIPYSKAAEPQKEITRTFYGPRDMVISNWTEFWHTFKQHAAWKLEGDRGEGWEDASDYLTIQRIYPSNNTCKITLVFDAPLSANYRFTFGIDKHAREYTHKEDSWNYTLGYEGYAVIFDWNDVKEIPNLVISHGIKEVDGEKWFWFRIRKDDVQQGVHLEIDPILTAYSTSPDGRIVYDNADTWAEARDASSGTGVNSVSTLSNLGVETDNVGIIYGFDVSRSWYYFNTSTIPDEATILSAILKIYIMVNNNGDICVQKGTQADILSTSEFDEFSGSYYAVRTSGLQMDEYNDLTFNSLGISEINKTGITKLCMRDYGHDYLNIAPYDTFYSEGLTYSEHETHPPKLEIRYWASLEYTGYEPVFQCAMNNMFELNGILEGNNTYRQMLLDTSPYENHGKIYPLTHPYAGPELTWGRMGKALHFDAVDDSVIIANSDSLNISEAITIEFWFSIYNDKSSKQVFISKADNSTYGEWIIGIENGTLYTELWTSFGDKYSNYTGNSLTSSIERGIFYFFSLTYDYRDGYYTVWLHGEPQYNVTTNGWYIQDTEVNLYLGNLGNSSLWFEGVLDEVRIFPYVRTYSEFHSDMRTPITRFASWDFVNSGISQDGSNWTVVEGTTNGYQGFKGNDPQLPWAYTNNTNPYAFLRTLRYVAGFQSYQIYCNVTFDTNQTGSYVSAHNRLMWYWNFFKNGRLQVSYYMAIYPESWVDGGVPAWIIRFKRSTPYAGDQELIYYYFNVNTTLFPRSIPIIVSAWVGPGNKRFTIRVDFQDSRVFTSSVYGGTPPFIHSFDLIDEELNTHVVDWFDGWMISGIQTKSHISSADTWSKMEIASHKFFIIAAIIITTVIVSAYTIYILTGAEEGPIGTIIKEITTVLQPITEVVGAAVKAMGDIVVDALAGLSHDIIAALSSLGNTVNQAMAPVYDTLSTWFGALIITLTDALGPAMFDAWLTFVGFLDTIGASVGVPYLFTNMINWILMLWDWVLISMTNLFSFLTSMFLIWVEIGTKTTSTFAQVITQWILIVQGIIYFLDTGYGYGVGLWDQLGGTTWLILAAILYPLWLLAMWEEEGFDVLLGHINFVINILAMLVRGFITIVSFFIRIVSTLIESIPIVE